MNPGPVVAFILLGCLFTAACTVSTYPPTYTVGSAQDRESFYRAFPPQERIAVEGVHEGAAAYARGAYADAARWYLRAATGEGDWANQARVNLGELYVQGKGVPQDYSQAMHWFLMAASRGEPQAMYDLGLLYAEGKGVPENKVRALQWMEQAAPRLGLAKGWIMKAANAGFPGAIAWEQREEAKERQAARAERQREVKASAAHAAQLERQASTSGENQRGRAEAIRNEQFTRGLFSGLCSISSAHDPQSYRECVALMSGVHMHPGDQAESIGKSPAKGKACTVAFQYDERPRDPYLRYTERVTFQYYDRHGDLRSGVCEHWTENGPNWHCPPSGAVRPAASLESAADAYSGCHLHLGN